MANNDISNATYGEMSSRVDDYEVDALTLDSPQDQKETTYINSNWNKQLGYYKQIPELKAAIDAVAKWTVGKGIEADARTKLMLDLTLGSGKDTFNTIIENLVRTYLIGGDSFAEIIRNEESGEYMNLKPLNPEHIKIVANKQGLIIRYEQINKHKKKNANIIFQPEEILHLSRDRVGDEIHGISLIDAVEDIILMRNEAMQDQKQLMHRYVRPRIAFALDTDDSSEIDAFQVKADKATNKGENLFIPKGAVEYEILSVPANSTLNPLPWIDRLNQYFFQATGVPQIIVGGAQEITEASAKIGYLAFEQTIKEQQIFIEEALKKQVGLKIKMIFPASLENEMLSDRNKAETMQAATPEDTGTGQIRPTQANSRSGN